MDSPGEILRLCRLCLVKDQVNIPIFEADGDSREIFLKISSCLPVKVSREDRLPKKICDGCSEKLNSFYEFWSSSANAEKTLLSWVGEEDVEEKKEPAVSKSLAASATLVKEESEPVDEVHAESIEESTKDEAEAPPAKRARRSAAVKAQINLAPDSEDDDLDMGEPLTKTEEESAESDGEDKDPSYTDMPGTSADDEQAGPSGMGKDGVEAPRAQIKYRIMKKGEPEDSMEEECNFKFRDHHNQLVVIPKNEWGYHCCYCVRKFTKRFDLKQHIVSHLLRSNNLAYLYICEPCDKTFRGEKALFRHRRKMHGTLNTFLCQACGQVFKSQLLCRRHHCSNVFPVKKPEEPIVMPVITSFGTVTDDTESKKRTDPTTGYESEYAKFLAVAQKDAKRHQLRGSTDEKHVKRIRKTKANKKVVVSENDDSSSVLETEPETLSVSTPSTSGCNKVKPKICVKEFAHFSG